MKLVAEAPRSATPAIVETLAQAFQDDPAFEWILPDPAQRARRLPHLFNMVAPLDFASGTVLHSPDGEVATLWRDPGKAKIATTDMIRAAIPLWRSFGLALGRALRVGDSIDAHHPREFDYLYLHYAGVRPAYQGKGWGGAAIRAGIARAASVGKPVYLETATASNVGLYQSLGFVVREEWDVAGGGPHFWSMLRR